MNWLKRQWGLWKTIGFRFTCPFCGWHARYFYEAGFDFPVLKKYHVVSAGRRDNVLCPRCKSSARERLMWLFLSRVKNPGDAILHVAPERNLAKKLKRPGYVSGDIKSGVGNILLDIQDLPFQEASFDTVICSHVLEHVIDDRRAFAELYRVLKPGGTALLQVPFSYEHSIEDPAVPPEDRAEVFGQSDHVRLYGYEDFLARAARTGFEAEPRFPSDFLSEKEIAMYSLDKKEPVFAFRKP
jgi:SAM-dependent methyltransferase